MRCVLLCLVAGCAASTSEVVWTRVAPDAIPLEEVVVYEAIQHEARVGVFFRGVETRLKSDLEACGVATTVRHGEPDEGSPASETWLSIRPAGGTYTKVYAANNEDIRTEVDGTFELRLFDRRVGKLTWRAAVDLKTKSMPSVSDGHAFAEVVLAKLRADAIVRCTK